MIFKKYILLILVFILLIITLNLKVKHLFWDKQPVMRENLKLNYGVIGLSPIFNIKLKQNQFIRVNNYPFKPIYEFLQSNFSNHYNIDEKYFRYIFEEKTAYNITLLEDHRVIGFIQSNIIPFSINNKIVKFQYVDYLCIDKKYRDNYLATVLIASIIKVTGNRHQPILFKKDSSSLPYSPIIKTNYYIKDITNIHPNAVDNIEIIDAFNFTRYYLYITILLKRYNMHRIYTKQEFFDLFLANKIMDCFIINNSNNKKTIIIGKKNIYKLKNMVLNCFEIELILGENRYNKDISKILTNYLKTNGYNYICIPFIGCNISFIKDNNYKKNGKLFYYTYNYNIPNMKINNFAVSIN